jgi:hypothetical protein
MLRYGHLPGIFTLLLLAPYCSYLSAKGVHVPGAVCRPMSQWTREIGCWIMADDPIGRLAKSPMFWQLDEYTARAAAEAGNEFPSFRIMQTQIACGLC